MHTRSGNRLLLNDETGDVSLESQKGRTIAIFYGNGNIEIKAPETMTLNAKNLNINVSQNMTTNVGMNASENVGMNKTTSIGLVNLLNVGADFMTNVVGKMVEFVSGNKESQIEKDRIKTSSGKIITESQGTNEFHSEKEIQNNSAEKSKLF